MTVEVIRNEHIIVQASGEIDLSNVDQLGEALTTAADEAPEGFIVDLSGATYIDSAGVQAILGAYKEVQDAHGRLALVWGSGRIRLVLEVVRLELLPDMFVCETLAQAEQAMA